MGALFYFGGGAILITFISNDFSPDCTHGQNFSFLTHLDIYSSRDLDDGPF